MPNVRISDLSDAAVPLIGTEMFEVEVPGTPNVSHKVKSENVLPFWTVDLTAGYLTQKPNAAGELAEFGIGAPDGRVYFKTNGTSIIGSDVYGGGTPFFFGSAARGTIAAPLPTQSGDVLLNFYGYGYGDTGFNGGGGGLFVEAAGTFTDTSNPTRVHFQVIPVGSINSVDALVLDTDSSALFGGKVSSLGYETRSGSSGPYTNHTFVIDWTGTVANLWIDNVNEGPIAVGGPYLPLAGGQVTGRLTVGSSTGGIAGSLPAGTSLWQSQANGIQSRTLIDSYGALGSLTFRHSAGTGQAPTIPAFGEVLGNVGGRAWDGTNWSNADLAQITFAAAEAYTTLAHGTKLNLSVTKNLTTTLFNALTLENDGGLLLNTSAGVNPTGGSKGPGTVNLSDPIGYYVQGNPLRVFLAGASTHSFPAAPAATTSTVGVMMGLGLTITPRISGKVFFSIDGTCRGSVPSSGIIVVLYYGTGTPPANGVAVTGTNVSNGARAINTTNSGDYYSFSAKGLVTGLVAGTTYWFDLGVASALGAGNSASVQTLTADAYEIL